MMQSISMSKTTPSLGDVLRMIRETRGFSQRNFARELYGKDCGATHVTIARAETGKNLKIPINYIKDLMAVGRLTTEEQSLIRHAIADAILGE